MITKTIKTLKKWIFTKGIGLFSLSYIRNTVCHINLEAKQLSPLLDFWKILAIAETTAD